MKGNKKKVVKEKVMEGKHHSGKGTRARLNTAAEKNFFKKNMS